jgi:hypothetical protein
MANKLILRLDVAMESQVLSLSKSVVFGNS